MNDEMDEIWALYADDGAQALDAMEEALDALQSNPDEAQAQIGALFRAVHTFKGNSRVLGLRTVESLAHVAEDLIGLVRDEGVPLSDDIIDILMLAGDTLRNMLEETATTHEDVAPEPSAPLLADLRSMYAQLRGAEVPEDMPPPAASTAPEPAPEPAAPPAQPEQAAPTASSPPPAAKPLAAGLDDLLSQLDGGSSFDFDDMFDDDDTPSDDAGDGDTNADAQPVAEADSGAGSGAQTPAESGAAAESGQPEADSAPATTIAEVASGEIGLNSLDDDPAYRKIFSDMVDQTIADLDALTADWQGDASATAARRHADGLCYACQQLRLAPWVAQLSPFAQGTQTSADDTATLCHALKVLRAETLGGPAPSPAAPQAEPEAAPEPAPAPAPEPKPEPEPQAAPVEQAKVEPAAAAPAKGPSTASASTAMSLDADPLYRKIFADMVDSCILELTQIAASSTGDTLPGAALPKAQGLAHAAGQLGLAHWCSVLDAFASTAQAGGRKGDLTRLIDSLSDLRAKDLAPETPAPTAAPAPARTPSAQLFLTEIAQLYPDITAMRQSLAEGATPNPEAMAALFEKISAPAQGLGYVHVVDQAQRAATATTAIGFAEAEFAFFETLVAVENTLDAETLQKIPQLPSAQLGQWCAAHVFETLDALRAGLSAHKAAESHDEGHPWFPAFQALMRRVHHACAQYQIPTASQLTMALLDLFERLATTNSKPDIILLQMARGYVDTMELVFDALAQGDTPDIARIEQMFEEAANLTFVASGAASIKAIERRLGLPAEFHRVLSPESMTTAQTCIDEGLHFYIVRADLNDDDALAQKFLECVTSGALRMITNVTVFLEQRTLFDFLLASSMPEDKLTELLAELDMTGKQISLVQVLEVRSDIDETEPEPDAPEPTPQVDTRDSLKLLDSISSISASQALVEYELSALANSDLMDDITINLRAHGLPPLDPRVRMVIRDQIEQHKTRLQDISEAGSQLGAQLAQLQQASVDFRSRPAEVLLRPLAAYVTTQAKQLGKTASMTYFAKDVVLDQLLIEELRKHLKALIALRLGADQAPDVFHISITCESDHIHAEITDNGATLSTDKLLAPLRADMAHTKAELRHVNQPGQNGMRFQMRVPLRMIVLDGMIVRVGKVRYVLPIDAIQRILQTDTSMPISAAQGGRMLNLGDDGLVPIRTLLPANGLPGQHRDNNNLYVIVQGNNRRVAIPVDELMDQQLVLLRPLEGVLASVRGMSGIAILSGGEVGMVVAVSALAAS